MLEANRLGCDIVGHDINPMSYWIVKQEIEHLDLDAYRLGRESLVRYLEEEDWPSLSHTLRSSVDRERLMSSISFG